MDKSNGKSEWLPLSQLLSVLEPDHRFPDRSEYPKGDKYFFIYCLNRAKTNLLNYFGDMLSGDFSRINIDDFHKQTEEKDKYFLIAMSLPREHPISIKFQHKDPSWFEDAKREFGDE